MGLTACGENGVKALIKARYSRAARTYSTLGDVRRATGSERTEVVVAMDGNVLMMQVPRSAASFTAYTGIVTSAIRQAMGSAHVVVVVFDEPEHLTAAKREEQLKRDANRGKRVPMCSTDIQPHPINDDYGLAELSSISDCHAIVGCRAARQRFFDETGRQVLLNLKKSIASWAGDGATSVVLFDGLDPRGANRPIGAPREAVMHGSDSAMAELFRRAHPIGEGDLKLAWVEERVRQLHKDGSLCTRLFMNSTIDTDSIAIELLEQARRNCEPGGESHVMGVLCMRERAQKRDEDDDASAVYWAVDYAELLSLIQRDMWKVKTDQLLPPAADQRAAMALVASGWALSGCDFCKLGGMRADLVFDAVPSMLKTAPELLRRMAGSWSGDRDAAMAVTAALRRLVLLCAGNYEEMPRARKATTEAMRNHDSLTLLRAAWTLSYWNQHEFCGDLHEWGFSRIYDGAVVQRLSDPPWSKKRASPAAADAQAPAAPAAPRVVSRFFADGAGASDAIERFRLGNSGGAL